MTQELDSLMATLTDFKVLSAPTETPVMRPNPSAEAKNKEKRLTELDSMLGQLEKDVSQTGVDTKSKGTCAACNKPILGKAITAMNKPWHIEHFACVQCNKELSTSAFYGYNGKPYCERDYQEMFAPRCAYCNGAIIDVSELCVYVYACIYACMYVRRTAKFSGQIFHDFHELHTYLEFIQILVTELDRDGMIYNQHVAVLWCIKTVIHIDSSQINVLNYCDKLAIKMREEINMHTPWSLQNL